MYKQNKYKPNKKRCKKGRAAPVMIACGLLALFFSGCGKSEPVAYTKTDFYFDTVVTLTVYEKPSKKDQAESLLNGAMDVCRSYDTLFDPHNPDGDLYKINNAGGEPVSVTEDTATLLYAALQFCQSSQGAIDITIQPAFELWDFSGENAYVPPEDRLNKAMAHVDYGNIHQNGTQVTLSDPDAAIGLGFIAKGYVADQVKAYLIENGTEQAIINLGGNVQTIGDKDGNGYSVGIQKPFAATGEYLQTVQAGEGDGLKSAVVTSGTYERCFTLNDHLYHHILDTHTGMPVETDLSSVTILSDSAMEADALSTACLLLGADEAKAYIDSLPDIEGILITNDGNVIEAGR